MLKAKDIMTPEPITVSCDTDMLEVIRVLAKNKITGLAVVDEEMKVLGIISEKDVLRIAYQVTAGTVEVDDSLGKVEDFMTKDVVSFQADDNLADVCQCLINNSFRRVFVTQDDKLVGLISRRDIIVAAFSQHI